MIRGSERMSKYLESCLHHCGENMTRPDVLNNPYCAGCEVYDILQTIEEHVQMKLDMWVE